MPEAKTPEKSDPKPEDKKAAGKPNTVTTTVWAAAGGVQRDAVLNRAVESVRDAIPVIYVITDKTIVGGEKSKRDGQDGTVFTVEISYAPRETVGQKPDPVDLEKVIADAQVAPSVHSVEGDPDFLAAPDDPGFPTK